MDRNIGCIIASLFCVLAWRWFSIREKDESSFGIGEQIVLGLGWIEIPYRLVRGVL